MSSLTPNFEFILPGVNDPTDQDLWGGYLNENWLRLDSILEAPPAAATIPIGAGMDFWGTTAPTGFVFAYGQALNRLTYAALFTEFGTTFGVGDGSTTFGIPDKRGRASFGKDDMGGTSADRLTGLSGGINGDVLGAVGGEQAHSLTESENGPHSHGMQYYSLTGGSPPYGPGYSNNGLGPLPLGPGTTSSGSGAAHNTVPPGIVCNYIIYAGV